MTRIVFGEGYIEVKGHSGYDVRGRDIVCAGISTACNAIAASLITLKKHGLLGELHIRAGEGEFKLSFSGESAVARDTILAFKTLFGTYAEEFPEHVNILFDGGEIHGDIMIS